MTLQEKAAQMVMVNLSGIHFPSRTDLGLVRDIGVGGVYRRRWTNLSRAVSYIADVQVAGGQSRLKIPPFVAGRYTCGMGQFMDDSTGVTPLPTQMATAATGNPDNAYLCASIAAKEMRSVGINMNFAPSLEVAPLNGDLRFATSRFGSDAEQVSRYGVQSVTGFQENGVVSVLADFPGVPDTPAVAGLPFPSIEKPIRVLSMTDLQPFRDALAAGADGIAVKDIVLPALDDEGLPTIVSSDVQTGLLREMWGFQGLIVADSISDKSISDNFESHDAVVRAVNAGADILLSIGGQWRHLTTIGHIIEGVKRGEIAEEALDAAVLRILERKERYGILSAKPPDLRSATRACGQASSLTATRDMLKRGITLIRNDGNLLPLSVETYSSVCVTGVVGAERMAQILERYWRNVVRFESRAASYDKWSVSETDASRAEELARGKDLIIVCTYSTERLPHGQETLVRRLTNLGKPVLVVALGSPFDITFLEDIHACIALYGPPASPSFVAANMESVVEFLFGDCPGEIKHSDGFTGNLGGRIRFDVNELVRMPVGRLPLTLESMYPRDFGLTSADFVSGARWDFGDDERADGIVVRHTYQNPSDYTVNLNVANAVGNVSALSFPLTVAENQ
jgi:beta-N-acetylhexosaminidase